MREAHFVMEQQQYLLKEAPEFVNDSRKVMARTEGQGDTAPPWLTCQRGANQHHSDFCCEIPAADCAKAGTVVF